MKVSAENYLHICDPFELRCRYQNQSERKSFQENVCQEIQFPDKISKAFPAVDRNIAG